MDIGSKDFYMQSIAPIILGCFNLTKIKKSYFLFILFPLFLGLYIYINISLAMVRGSLAKMWNIIETGVPYSRPIGNN